MSLRDLQESDTEEWRITWDRDEEPVSRTTTIAAVAWVAKDDPEATVENA